MHCPPCPNRPRVLPSLAMLLCLALNPAAWATDLSARVSPPGPDGTLELTPRQEPSRAEPSPAPPEPQPEPKGQMPAPALAAADGHPAQTQPETGPPSEASSAVLALEAEIQPTTVLVRQQVILTARVYMPAEGGVLARLQLYDPRVAGAHLLPLGEDSATVTRDDHPYWVYERRYALFPQQTGTLPLDPLVADAWILAPGQTAPTQQRARSKPLSLRVEPAPESEPARPWLPAQALTLSESPGGLVQVPPSGVWQRLVTLTVAGQAAETLPELFLVAPHPLDTHRDRPRLWNERTPDGVIGHRQEALLVSGREPGLYRLPEIRIDWWNTATGAWEAAILPPRDLQVLAEPHAGPPPPGNAATIQDAAEQRPPGPARTDRATTSGHAGEGEPGADKGAILGAWAWASVGLGLGLGLGAVLLWRRTPTTERIAPPPMPESGLAAPILPTPLEPLAEDIRIAYGNGDANAARAALLAWARLAWPHNPPGNLTQLALRSPEPAGGRIALLDQAFFSPSPLDWNHEPLWKDLPAIAAVAAREPPPVSPKRRLGRGPRS